MEQVLIAFDNAPDTDLHSFFESCADEAKQCCVNNGHRYTSIWPPNLTKQNVVGQMDKYTICFIASHGEKDGVYNNESEELVSVHTTNYNFAGKTLYAVSCSCAISLKPELQRIGLDTFVGYSDNLIVPESDPSFLECAMSGLNSLLSGETKEVARNKMNAKYDECIANASTPFIAAYLIHNKENLCFE